MPFGPIAPVPVIGITRRANWLPTQLHDEFMRIVRRRMAVPLSREAWKLAS